MSQCANRFGARLFLLAILIATIANPELFGALVPSGGVLRSDSIRVVQRPDPVPDPDPEPTVPPRPADRLDPADDDSEDDAGPPRPADAAGPEPEVLSRDPFPRLAMRRPRRSVMRLASVPNMFGDYFGPSEQIRVGGNFDSLADLPLTGGAARLRIAENNKALPMDRVYFMYHHFQNAMTTDHSQASPNTLDQSVDRYTVGMERTFADGLWSVDVRIPFFEPYQFSSGTFAVSGGGVGNLDVVLKRRLAMTDTSVFAAGLGINMPTGSDVIMRADAVEIRLRNEAVHLSPFVGFLTVPNECFFYQGFLQVDVPTDGNSVDYVNGGQSRAPFGVLNEQTLLGIDLSAGRWLYRDPCAGCVTGLAALFELHYTTTLQDADEVAGAVDGASFQLGNTLNRIDMVNLSAGLHWELRGRTTVRVTGVVPLDDDHERPFDAEVHVSINRYF